MKKDSYIRIRVPLQRKADWKYCALQQGMTLTSWIEKLANDACELPEEVAEEKREERRLVQRGVSGKRSFVPDFK